VTDDEPLPAIEQAPPYTLEFIAHLHGECYGDDITPQLLAAATKDEAGKRMLDELTIVRLELALMGSRAPRTN
jgi:hypothetical protein